LPKLLVVRLGAMGDILHTIPAVAALRHSFPRAELAWILHPRWMPLVSGLGLADHLLPFDRRSPLGTFLALRWLNRFRPDTAIDFQGLLKSGALAWFSSPERLWGLAPKFLRESHTALFYTDTCSPLSAHIVDRHLELAAALGASPAPHLPQPRGLPEGSLPTEPFVLAAPFAGWASKQWPIERYIEIGRRLWLEKRLRLVLNVIPGAPLPSSEFLFRHESGLEGLIDATHRATAVLGLDSGPLHLAAFLGKPGLALFGPTDPARNGPHGNSIRTLRQPGAPTSYRRHFQIAPSMLALDVDSVWHSLAEVLP
jgi:heptosyltransferase-1